MRLEKALAVRPCARDGCTNPRLVGPGNHRYCAEHFVGANARHVPSAERHAEPPRSLAAIRADLAAQLTAQVRRFGSMVAHDRLTDPLR